MLKLTTAQKRTAKSGKIYYSASLGLTNVVIFPDKDGNLDIMLDERKGLQKPQNVPQDRRNQHPYAPRGQSQQTQSQAPQRSQDVPNFAPQGEQPAWDSEDLGF